MRIRFTGILCMALLGAASAAAAGLTVKNLDPEDRKITIKENDKKTEKVLKPSEVVTDACTAACEIETGEGDVYDFDGNEFVTIEEGLLFIGEEETPSKPQ